METPKVCQHCNSIYEDPRTLNCLHSFCLKCISEIQLKESCNIICPSCNEPSPIPKQGVVEFPSNIRLKEDAEQSKLVLKFTSSPPPSCDSCEEGSSLPSVAYCIVCGDFLCKECWAIHRKMKISRSHSTFALEDVENKQHLLTNIPNPAAKSSTLTCSVHPDIEIGYYCTQCSTSICPGCIVGLHKGHQIQELKQWADSQRVDLMNYSQSLLRKRQNVGETLEHFCKTKEEFRKRKNEVEETLMKEFVKLRELLDQEQAKALTSLHNIATVKESQLSIQIEDLQKLSDSIEYCQSVATSTGEEYSDTQLLFIANLVVKRATSLTNQCSSLHKCESAEITLRNKIAAVTDALTGIVAVIDPGALATETSATFLPPLSRAIATQSQMTVTVRSTVNTEQVSCILEPINPAPKSKRSRKHQSLNCAVFNNGDCTYTISVAPKCVGEHSLSITIGGYHILDSPFSFNVIPKRDYSLITARPSKTINKVVAPTNIAFSDDGLMFVTSFSQQCIYIYELSPKPKKKSTIKNVEGVSLQGPYGIDIKGEVVYITEYDAHRIVKITQTGELLDKFGEYGTGTGQLNHPSDVKVSPADSKVYVSDTDNHRIQVFNDDFIVSHIIAGRSVVNGRELCKPHGICFDSAGNVYVAWSTSYLVTVHEPKRGDLVHQFNKSSISAPFRVVVDSSGYCMVRYYDQGLAIFDPRGNMIKSIPNDGLSYGVSSTPDGLICTTNCTKNTIDFY